jgi:ribosomal protein S18 acetylase RimI-like enzyme
MRAPSAAVELRPASPADTPALRRLGQRAFAEYDPDAGRTVERMLNRSSTKTLVAEQRGVVLGFVVLEPEGRGAFAISALAVDVEQRGRGVGERLMRAAEREARAGGAKLLTLTTAQANVSALSLFLRLGFRIKSRSARYYGAQPACALHKVLA